MDDQLRSIREERARRFASHSEVETKEKQKNDRELYLFEKYKNLIVLDKKTRSAFRIQHFAKKYVFRNTLNHISDLPGLFRQRINMTNLNMMSQNEREAIEETRNIMISSMVEDVDDPDMREALIMSIPPEEYQTIGCIMVDLRIYGPFFDLNSIVLVSGASFTFTSEQRKLITDNWDAVNPDTSRGIRYGQMIECSKELVKVYNKTKP